MRRPGRLASSVVTKVLLSLHVLAAVVAVGPVTVAASMFPSAAGRGDIHAMRLLHRVCRVYAVLGLAVPVLGLATAVSLGVLGNVWLIVSIVLTVIAAAVLGLAVLPAQEAAVNEAWETTKGAASRRLSMVAGLFNLLWAAVVVLMIFRPGSTTGA